MQVRGDLLETEIKGTMVKRRRKEYNVLSQIYHGS